MQTNNQYYKAICENMNIPVEQGVHNNNYYLKQIATVGYGKSYTGTVCNGILIKDIAEAITESTYTGHHFTNFYLKEIASALTGDDYNTEFDNYYLNIWAENAYPSESSLLNWNPPTYMEYSDFNATGLLTDTDNNPISDATVYLVVGSTKVDNAQTNSNGVVTFTGSPVHTGTHSFKLVFEGNTNYTSSESSTVTITISKETTLLEVTSPANNSTWYDDGNILVTGSLLDNDSPDSSPVANATIWAMLSWWDNRGMQDMSREWGETNSAGEFSIIIPAPSYDDMSASDKRGTLRIWYQGDDDYTGNSQENIILNIAKPSLDLVADKPILSYVDEQQTAGSQVCTVTATVNSGVSREGEVMSFTVKDSGGTVVETGSAIVDSSNQCEYEYVSKGLGDVTVEAEVTVSGTLVSKTFAITDAWKYGFKNVIFNGTLSSQLTITDDSLTIKNARAWKAGNSQILIPSSNDLWEVSFDMECVPVSAMRIILQSEQTTGSERLCVGIENGEYYGSPKLYTNYNSANSGSIIKGNEISFSSSVTYHVKIVRTSVNSVQLFINDISELALTNVGWLSDDIHLNCHMWEGSSNTNGKTIITNFKIIPL